MELNDLCGLLDATEDTASTKPAINPIPCVVPGCNGKLTAKFFSRGNPKYSCDGGCSPEAREAAIAALVAKKDSLQGPGGEELPPPSRPASPQKQSSNERTKQEPVHTNGHANGNGKVHRTASKLAHAIAYARKGIKVFPLHEIESDRECSCGKLKCDSAGKHPRMSGWQASATLDEDQIKDWWREWPNANVGVKCGSESNLTVLDVDGEEGRATLRSLELEHGELPDTAIATTGRGGAHYLFTFEDGLQNAVKFAPGLDVRTEGGLIVGVGSKTTGPYIWEAAFSLADIQPAVMPQWLADQIRMATGPKANGRPMVPANVHEFVSGSGRNDVLYRLGRSMKAQGFSAAAIEAALTKTNQDFKQPFSVSEINAQISHIIEQPDRSGFGPPTVKESAPIAPILWENFSSAVAANEEYLKREPVVDKLQYRKAVSMVVGGKHHGKSTLVRYEAICVVKGWQFLGRAVTQGPVFYVASEDETMTARQELIRLGWTAADQLFFFSASNMTSEIGNFLQMLTQEIQQHKPVLVVIDMLFDFITVSDEMGYAETRRAVGEIQKVASAGDTHIVTTHHAPKYAQIDDASVAALGSQGLAARVSPIILVRKHGPGVHSVVSTSVRDPRGEAIPNSRLIRNEDGTVELGGMWKDWMQAEVYAPQALEIMGAEEGAEMTASDLAEQLDVSYRLAAATLSSLYKQGKIGRTGSGKKGKPFRYALMLESDKQDLSKSDENGKVIGLPLSPNSEQPEEPGQGRFGYKED